MTERAKQPSKDLYKQAWTHHINELAALALAADIPYSQWRAQKETLFNWLDTATNNLYEDR